METRILPGTSLAAHNLAVRLLKDGSLVAFPTDTVYGLGANIADSQAIEKLFEVKDRVSTKAIAVLVGRTEDVERGVGRMNAMALKLANRFWPGPLTLVVPALPGLPDNLSPTPTVGVRQPDHPVALRLLSLSGPLAVTSANRSGEKDSLTAQEVIDQLSGQIPLVLDGGRTPGGTPSTVIDCTGEELTILRHGPLTLEQLKEGIA